MFSFGEATVEKIIIHKISLDDNRSYLSNELYSIEDDENIDILKNIFLKPFENPGATFEFKHDIDINLNPLFKLSTDIFEGENFIDSSKDIFQHLKNASTHPNIKDGELFLVKYDNVLVQHQPYEALGIYKIEQKENFIETASNAEGAVGLNFKKGIGNRRLDKACLIIFTEKPYTILIIDNGSREAEYWSNDFIHVDLRNDEINNTNRMLHMTKHFVTEEFPSIYEVSKADQIHLLNRSVDYFKTHEKYNKAEFENEVLQHQELIDTYRSFDEKYRNRHEMDIIEDFDISSIAVKKQSKIFKSVLKLDRNFHIYIHGNKEMIERGYDEEKELNFYKVYYQNEA